MYVNFIEEMNAFFRWNRTNYLPPASQLLWYKLFMLFNESGWSEWIEATNQELMALIRYSNETTFIGIRDSLIEKGLILYKKGKKGVPNRYKMLFLTTKNGVYPGVETGVHSGVQIGVYPGVETGDLYKLNEIKQNEDNPPPKSPEGEEGEEGEKNSSTAKEKKEYPPINKQIGDYTDSEELRNALEQFVVARKKMKKVLTEYAFYCLLRDLDRLAKKGYDKLECVDMAISRGWQGFYEPYKRKQVEKQEQKGGFIDNLGKILEKEGEL